MNIAKAMSAYGAKIQTAIHSLPQMFHSEASNETESRPVERQYRGDVMQTLFVVYKCNRHSALATCRCGTRFTADVGLWPCDTASNRPVCLCCDSRAAEITTNEDLCRAAAQAHFLFDIDQEVTMQTVAALRQKRVA
jgi:hypothetical protein